MASEATLKMILLGVDKGATRLLNRTGHESEKTGGKMAKFGKVGKWAAAGVAAGLTAAAGAAVAFAKSSIHAYQDVAKESSALSRVTGVNIKQASQLRFAAEESGVEFGVLQKSMQKFAKAQSVASDQFTVYEAKLKDAAKHHKKLSGHLGSTATAYARLGVSIKDARGKAIPMQKVLEQTADQFKKMPDGPEKTALAMQLFGKAGADMIKLLNKGGEGLREFAKEADKTGNSISNTDAYKKQLKAQREFHASITGLKIQLGQALYPALTAISQQLAEKAGPAITKFLPLVRKLGEWVQVHVVPAIKDLAEKYVAGVSKAFEQLKPHLKDLQPYWVAFSTILTKVLLPAMGKLYQVVFPAVGLALTGLVIGLGAVAKAGIWMWNNALQPAFKFLTQAVVGVLRLWAKMLGALSHVPGFGWAKSASKSLRDAANATDKWANSLNRIHSKSVKFSLQISAQDRLLLTNPKASPVLRSLLSGKATGGWINQSGFYDVGEVGRERVYLPRGSRVQSTASMQREAATSGGTASAAPIVININGVGFDKRHAAKEIVEILKGAGVSTGSLVMA